MEGAVAAALECARVFLRAIRSLAAARGCGEKGGEKETLNCGICERFVRGFWRKAAYTQLARGDEISPYRALFRA